MATSSVFRVNQVASEIDVHFSTDKKNLEKRGLELGEWEVDALGFPNDLSEMDYPVLLYLEGTHEHVTGYYLPEEVEQQEGNQRREQVEGGTMLRLLNSLARAGVLLLRQDANRDAAGTAVAGYSCGIELTLYAGEEADSRATLGSGLVKLQKGKARVIPRGFPLLLLEYDQGGARFQLGPDGGQAQFSFERGAEFAA